MKCMCMYMCILACISYFCCLGGPRSKDSQQQCAHSEPRAWSLIPLPQKGSRTPQRRARPVLGRSRMSLRPPVTPESKKLLQDRGGSLSVSCESACRGSHGSNLWQLKHQLTTVRNNKLLENGNSSVHISIRQINTFDCSG